MLLLYSKQEIRSRPAAYTETRLAWIFTTSKVSNSILAILSLSSRSVLNRFLPRWPRAVDCILVADRNRNLPRTKGVPYIMTREEGGGGGGVDGRGENRSIDRSKGQRE